MKKTKLLAGVVLSLLGGVAMVGTTSATGVVKATVGGIGTLTICNDEYYNPLLPISKFDAGYSHFTLASTDGTYTYKFTIDGSNCITIMDRNLGATKTGSAWACIKEYVCSSGRQDDPYQEWESYEQCYNTYISRGDSEEYAEKWCTGYLHGYDNVDDCGDGLAECESGTFGNYYQWGNNYGFSEFGSVTTGGSQINCSDNSPSNPVSSSVFIVGYNDYCTGQNDNLWGGSGDYEIDEYSWYNIYSYPLTAESALARRGPCPEGFHVPSAGEWEELLNIRAGRITHGSLDLDRESGEKFHTDLQIPNAGIRSKDDGSLNYQYTDAFLWSSSSDREYARFFFSDGDPYVAVGDRADGYPIRCFKDSPLSFPPYIESTNSGIQVTVGEIIYSGLSSNIMTVTTNNVVNVEEDKPVAGEVSVSFGENVSAKFSELVKINVPVEDYDQVIIKVKHAGSSGYNFDGLTTNANASCDANGRPTSSQYNGELITVVNGFASIYTCEASDFVALGLGGGSGNNVTGVVVTLTLTAGENTCTINDYNLGTHNVSAQEQYVSASGQDIACRFLKNSGAIVTLSMGNLVDGTKTIGNQYFTGIVTNIGPSLGSIANLAGGSYNLGATRAIYTKGENTIGSWTGSLALEGTIPAGTPSGEYTGAIEIVIQQPTWTE